MKRLSIYFLLIAVIANNAHSKLKTKTVGEIEFVYIKSGEFMMGSEKGRSDEKPVHKVYISGFWMGKYEVSQKQYQTIMSKKPNRYTAENLPAETRTWNEAKDFCNKFSEKYGIKARLPYEAEWEYACRAGTTTEYYWGDHINVMYEYCNFADKNWKAKLSEKTQDDGHMKAAPVGSYKANKFGLYDMSGNVNEWCMDWYDKKYYNSSPSKNPKGPSSGKYKVLRGGSFCSYNRLIPST